MVSGPIIIPKPRVEAGSEKPQKPALELEANKPEPEGIEGNARKHFRILIAEDESMVRTTLSRVLKDKRWTMVTAEDGVQALDIYKKGGIDLVMSDRQMPNMGGLQLLRELKEITPGVKFILLSGGMSQNDQEEFEKEGAMRILEKPFDAAQVRDAIESCLFGK